VCSGEVGEKMRSNLKNFPPDEGSSIEEAIYIAPYQIWKEAFEKELRESMHNLCVDCKSPCVAMGVCDAFEKLKEILGE
jgi:chemotaxis regulatin CheY-phosphate phosphatase CheZ